VPPFRENSKEGHIVTICKYVLVPTLLYRSENSIMREKLKYIPNKSIETSRNSGRI